MNFENWLIGYIVISFFGGIFVGCILSGSRQLGGDDRISQRRKIHWPNSNDDKG